MLFGTRKKFLYAVAVLVGTMVGVGIFGIPFSFMKAGFWVGFSFLLAVGAMTLIMDLMHGEVVLRTEEKHQIVGYAGKYAGGFLKNILFFSIALSVYSALLAYIVVSGEFLNNIFSSFFQLSPGQYSVIFTFVVAGLILAGVKRFSPLELFLSVMFLAVIGLIFAFGFTKINTGLLTGWNPEFWILPYGVLLFAFAGLPAIPIQRKILDGQEVKLKKAIIYAVLFVSVLYFIFALTVVGISGEVTSPDAVSGLYEFMGPKIAIAGSVFGVLAVFSSFLMLGSAMLDLYAYDYGFKRKYAWLMVIFPPFLFFLAGIRSFIDIIDMAGAVAIGLESMVLVFMFARAKSRGNRVPEYSINLPVWSLYALVFIFVVGVSYALFK